MEGFALLGSHLGDLDRKILTPAGIRQLTERMKMFPSGNGEQLLTLKDLTALGYGSREGENILSLLNDRDILDAYLAEGRKHRCFLLTRGEEAYPALLRKRLGGESPCCLFYKGDPELIKTPCISLVGSRDLNSPNAAFAREAGYQAAEHGLTLVSGNARGADRTAQQACLEAGGRVISVVADSLTDKIENERILYLSQEDFDAPFSAQRALSRNHVIHALGCMTLVCQCSFGTGGTWSGTTRNLQKGWSLVVCFRDGSEASLALQQRGAYLMDIGDLSHLTDIRDPQMNLFD